MKEGVKWPYIPYDEYRLRIDRAKQLLQKHEMDAMLLFSPFNWWYYAGWAEDQTRHASFWRSALIILPGRDPIAVAHPAYRACLSLTTYIEDVRYWHEFARRLPTSFWALLYDSLAGLGLTNKVLGIETGHGIDTFLSFDELDILKKGLPDAKIVSADKVIWEQRMIKTPYEVEVLREAGRRGCAAVRAAFEAIKPGVNELEVHRVFWETAVRNGLLEGPLRQTQWLCWTSNPKEAGGIHRWICQAVDRIIEVGDQGICDGGPTYRGYRTDFQRSFYVGDPPQKQLSYSGMAKEAFFHTLAVIKPGIRICDIYEAGVKNIQKMDPSQRVNIIDFLGHSIGLMRHEPPWIRAKEETVVQPGMVLCVEMGVFDRAGEVVGAMPEDMLLVTEHGFENLTRHMSQDLWIAK